jgi:hypothetical protein
MIPTPEFKKALGTEAANLSDAEIEHMRDLGDQLADIVFDTWLRKRNAQAQVAETVTHDIVAANSTALEKAIFLPESSDTGTG